MYKEKVKINFLNKTKDVLDYFIDEINKKDKEFNLLKNENLKLKERIKTLENKLLELGELELEHKEAVIVEEVKRENKILKSDNSFINDEALMCKQLTFDGFSSVNSKGIISSRNNFYVKVWNGRIKGETALTSLGYSTTKGKQIRWDILKNRAIPELGLEKTKLIIKKFINYNGKSPRQKRALGEWKFDLDRLNNL
ncbi:hypothetical protein [Clostridium tarantellae]|uniref:Uncharacterized protein n=1 Tax=Clostridium tarantellae TaxID=39493 RepID=A0A6I1MIL2_9CLOT|nr:hypothetical protein [Clostridium tarantellae]MPQ43386.1 hypothetical protein [Clostridium tarantellae]